MRIGRAIIISTLLAVGSAGATIAGSVMPAAAANLPAAHAYSSTITVGTAMYYHG
jgi:hypothetical protein